MGYIKRATGFTSEQKTEPRFLWLKPHMILHHMYPHFSSHTFSHVEILPHTSVSGLCDPPLWRWSAKFCYEKLNLGSKPSPPLFFGTGCHGSNTKYSSRGAKENSGQIPHLRILTTEPQSPCLTAHPP